MYLSNLHLYRWETGREVSPQVTHLRGENRDVQVRVPSMVVWDSPGQSSALPVLRGSVWVSRVTLLSLHLSMQMAHDLPLWNILGT